MSQTDFEIILKMREINFFNYTQIRTNSHNFHLSSYLSLNHQHISLHPNHFSYHFCTHPQNKVSHLCWVDIAYIFLFLSVYFLQTHLKMNLHSKIKKYHAPTQNYPQTLLCKSSRCQIYIYHNLPFFLQKNCQYNSLHLGPILLPYLMVQTQRLLLCISSHSQVLSLLSACFEITEIDFPIPCFAFITKVPSYSSAWSNLSYKLQSSHNWKNHFSYLYHFICHRIKETRVLLKFIEWHSILRQGNTDVNFNLSRAL